MSLIATPLSHSWILNSYKVRIALGYFVIKHSLMEKLNIIYNSLIFKNCSIDNYSLEHILMIFSLSFFLHVKETGKVWAQIVQLISKNKKSNADWPALEYGYF